MRAPFNSKVKAQLFTQDGDLILEAETTNFLTEAGEAHIADRLSSSPGEGAMSHMRIGDGSGQTRADTDLDSILASVALDSFVQGTSGDDNDVIYTCTFPAGTGTGTVTEGGIANSSTGGTLLNYFTFSPPIEKGASQSVVLTVTITCGYS